MRKWITWLVGLAVLVALLATLVPEDAWARAGGGFSSGSRGSRSFSSPSQTYRAPAPSASPQPSTQPRTAPTPAPISQPAPAGGFLRGLAGGIVGGLLGGMLFRSLGFAGGPGEGFGSGFGMMDLLLLAGIAYLIFWFVKRKRAAQELPAGAYASGMSADTYGSGAPAATLDARAPSWQQD